MSITSKTAPMVADWMDGLAVLGQLANSAIANDPATHLATLAWVLL
jgi:hypothetical protein